MDSTESTESTSRPPQYLGWAIIMAFLAPLFGYFALFHSWRLGVLYEAGDLEGAARQSRLTRSWLRFAVVMFVIIVIAWVVIAIGDASHAGNSHVSVG